MIENQMNNIKLELTEQVAKIYDEVMEKVKETAAFLASLPHADRLDWLKEHQYSHPISFEREIGGTVYTENAHFSRSTDDPVEDKVIRILNRNIAR